MTRRSNQQIWVVISIVLMASLSPAAAKVIYVDANAPGPTHNGSTWANAYKFLQDALADADHPIVIPPIPTAPATVTLHSSLLTA
jgi:hypothetical protein